MGNKLLDIIVTNDNRIYSTTAWRQPEAIVTTTDSAKA